MGFRNNSYATFWGPLETSQSGALSARISISYRSQRTGNFEQSFGGYVRFSGGAAEKAKSLKERDRIKILECDVTNHYDPQTKKLSWSPIIFDFEVLDASGRPAHNSAPAKSAPPARAPQAAPSPTEEEEGLPF